MYQMYIKQPSRILYLEPEDIIPPTTTSSSDTNSYYVTPEPPTINNDNSNNSGSEQKVVKSAPIDTVVFVDETLSENLITDLLFEDIAGQELLSIARNDTVNGQTVSYQPIKNLNILNETYNPVDLLKIKETSNRYFNNFVINLREKIPTLKEENNYKNYYIDDNGNLIIELINIRLDEQVEIQLANGAIIDEIGI